MALSFGLERQPFFPGPASEPCQEFVPPTYLWPTAGLFATVPFSLPDSTSALPRQQLWNATTLHTHLACHVFVFSALSPMRYDFSFCG